MGPHRGRCGRHPHELGAPSASPRLQWGHIVVDVEDGSFTNATEMRATASMGPHRGRCGRHSVYPRPIVGGRGFNGATSWSMWKTAKVALYQNILSSFNGATSWSMWKTRTMAFIRMSWTRFNGATSWSMWKTRLRTRSCCPISTASMGPHRGRCGRQGLVAVIDAAKLLQWGHIVVDVEDTEPPVAAPPEPVASMGPHRGRCGRRPPSGPLAE